MKKDKAAAHDDLDLKYKLILISSPFDCILLINQLKMLTAFSSKHPLHMKASHRNFLSLGFSNIDLKYLRVFGWFFL